MSKSSCPIVDFHCDLLLYLYMQKERTPLDSLSRTSYSQLSQGNVRLQTLAIFTQSKSGSVPMAKQQIETFLQMPTKYKGKFEFFSPQTLQTSPTDSIQIMAAFENAYGFCEEAEPIEKGLVRLDEIHKLLKHILYISMTWDGENRFGGGNGSKVGLKEDGKKLLEWMQGKQIAIDMSHASDFLISDILNYMDKRNLSLPIIASHSNFRSITNVLRNLPDELAKEIIDRDGRLGLVFFSPFSGNKSHKDLLKHIAHAIKLGGEKALCFGSDFFCIEDFPSIKEKYKEEVGFYPELSNSSCYPYLQNLMKDELGLSQEQIENISFKNALHFLKKLYK